MAKKNQEVEIKLEFNDSTYRSIISQLGNPLKKTHQANYFLDTQDKVFSGKHWAFRIRVEPETAFLTAKGSVVQKGAAMVRPEYEQTIPSSLADTLIKGFRLADYREQPVIKHLLELSGGNQEVDVYLSFINERLDFSWENIIIQLDVTRIKNKTFYELEAEIEADQIDVTEKKLKSWFQQNDWPYTPSRFSKLERAIKVFNVK